MTSIKGKQTRSADLERTTIDVDARTVQVAISSENPVSRWFGNEILSHRSDSVDLDRLQDGGAVLLDHDPTSLVGVVEGVELGADRVLRGTLRFGRSVRASEAFQDVVDGIRTKISVGYNIEEFEVQRAEKKGDPDTVTATRWTPLEVSFVSIPADASVGVGRSDEATPGISPDIMEVRMDHNTNTATAEETRAANQATVWEAVQLRNQAELLGLGRAVDEMLQAGKGLTEIRSEVLRLVPSKPIQSPSVDMSPKEARQYSYARAVAALVSRAEGMRYEAGFEDEVSQTLERSLPSGTIRHGGMYVPMQTRTAGSSLDSITSTAGTELKYTEYGGEVFDLLRNLTAVIQMGARVMTGLNGPVSFPRVTADATVSWVAENPGSDVAATAPLLGSVGLTAKTLQGAIPYTRQLLQQSVWAVESFVRENLAFGHALAIDKAAIHGTGSSNQPTGIYKTTGVNTKAMGGVPTFGKLQDMITEVAIDNALMRSLGWLTTPGMYGKMAQTLAESSAGSDHIWTGTNIDGRLNGYKAVSTNQVSAVMSTLEPTGGSSHGLIFGDWSRLIIGFWGSMELVVDPYSLKKQAMIEIASYQLADMAISHPGAFCVATGATIA